MTASYPSTVRTFTTHVDLTDIVWADHVNALQEEVRAVQLTLGTTPQAGHTSVSARILALENAPAANNTHSGLVNPGKTTGDDHPQYVRKDSYTAKGVVLSGSSAGVITAVAAPGANGQIPISDSSQAGGWRWGTPAEVTPSTTPPGVILEYAGGSAPAGYLLCDGTAVNRTTYSALFAVIGVTYGPGDGASTFNLPDKRGRVGVGLDNMGGSDAGRLSVANTLGGSGGAATHTLTTNESPNHTHVLSQSGHSHGVSDPGHSHGFSDPGHSHTPGAGLQYVIGLASGQNHFAGISNPPGNSGSSGVTFTGFSSPAGTGASIQAAGVGVGINAANANITANATGGGAAHNNLQPYILLNYIIKT